MIPRILIVGCSPMPYGIASYVMNIYRHMDRSRVQYDFLIPSRFQEKETPISKEILRLGGRLFYLEYETNQMTDESALKLRELLSEHPEIRGVHVQAVHLQTQAIAIAEDLGLPVRIIHSHMACAKSQADRYESSADYLERLEVAKREGVVRFACSDLSGQYMFRGLPFTVAKNAIDTGRFRFEPFCKEITRRQLGIPDHAYLLGFVANEYAFKNHYFALEVFERFLELRPESFLCMVGHGHSNGKLNAYIDEHGLRSNIKMMKAQSSMDMVYSAMDMILSTSFYEGMPFVLIEAQASGLPCLISDEITDMIKLTPLAKMISLKEGADVWAREILHMLDERKERESQTEVLKEAGYDIRDAAKEMMSLYLRMLKEDRP